MKIEMSDITEFVLGNETKKVILERLFKSTSICMCCSKKDCPALNRELPNVLNTEDVLHAINLNEHFYKETE